MNKIKLAGIALIGLGTLQHSAGAVLRSRRMQASGFAWRVSGESKLAIGTALVRIGGRLQAVKKTQPHALIT